MQPVDIEPVMERDRNYFANHPNCKYYVRKIHPLELEEARLNGRYFDTSFRVLVCQIEEGFRVRKVFPPNEIISIKQARKIRQFLKKAHNLTDPTLSLDR